MGENPKEEDSKKVIDQLIAETDESDVESPNQDDPNEIQGFKLKLNIDVQPQKNTQSSWDIKEKHAKRESGQGNGPKKGE